MSAVGNFFAIDSRCWARVCCLGLNAAIAYLILARFSGVDQLTTKAGVHAVEKYTGISRKRAVEAIKKLEGAGLLGSPNASLVRKIVAARDMPKPPPLDQFLPQALEKCREGKKVSDWDVERLEAAVASGSIVRYGTTYALSPEIGDAPEWIWLPNTLVDGAAIETSPLELLRQVGDPMLIRLLVDLYHAHNLASDGGIHWRMFKQAFTRFRVGTWRNYTVWGFAPKSLTTTWSTPFHVAQLRGVGHQKDGQGAALFTESCEKFWERWRTLNRFGLLEIVPHLVEADTDEAEILYPYGIDSGEAMECELAASAHNVARAMISDAEYQAACEALGGNIHLAIAPQHMADVQMVGVVRLLYRPHTGGAAGWWAMLHERHERWMAEFGRLDEAASGKHATSR